MEALKKILGDEDEVDLTPMIDVTFLLLIYFMVTTMLKQPEAELSSDLPGKAQNSGESIKKPDPVKIRIEDDGSVFLNESFMDDGQDISLPETLKNLINGKSSSSLKTAVKVVKILNASFKSNELKGLTCNLSNLNKKKKFPWA